MRPTSRRNSAGSADDEWSGPGIRRSSVKCFSTTQAPSATAAMQAVSVWVWSEYPTETPKAVRIVTIARRFASATSDG